MKKAFQGAYAVYGVTNYWEKMDMDLEIQQGKNLADAALVRVLPLPCVIWDQALTVRDRKLVFNNSYGARFPMLQSVRSFGPFGGRVYLLT